MRVDPQQLDQLAAPGARSGFEEEPRRSSPPACRHRPAPRSAQIVFTADDAVEQPPRRRPVILVRKETVPDDIHGMEVAKGILTARGGMTSHAAVVARGMGIPCVAGAEALAVDEHKKAAQRHRRRQDRQR